MLGSAHGPVDQISKGIWESCAVTKETGSGGGVLPAWSPSDGLQIKVILDDVDLPRRLQAGEPASEKRNHFVSLV